MFGKRGGPTNGGMKKPLAMPPEAMRPAAPASAPPQPAQGQPPQNAAQGVPAPAGAPVPGGAPQTSVPAQVPQAAAPQGIPQASVPMAAPAQKKVKTVAAPAMDDPGTPKTAALKTEEYYDVKAQVFSALIDTIDLSQLSKLDAEGAREEIRDIVNDIIAIKSIVMSISEQ